MPREGDTPLARFARALSRDDGLTIGAPWLSDDNGAAILPILRTAARPRRWRLASEASDTIGAVDPGRLDRLTVRNDGAFAVVLPLGSLFRGDATASRATTAGVAIGPRTEASVEVKCVSRSRPLTRGAALAMERCLAPDLVCRALLSRDQGRVWEAVAEFVGGSQNPSAAGSDDLVAALADADASAVASDGAPLSMSVEPGQCGVVVLDAWGVSAVEWFDSPEAWKVVARSVLRRHARCFQPRLRPPWKVSLDAPGAIRVAKAFLAALGETPLRRVAPSSWIGTDFSLSCTSLGEDLIHLVLFGRRDGPDRRGAASGIPASSEAPMAVSWPGQLTHADRASNDADVAVAEVLAEGLPEDTAEIPPGVRPRRRKVLTSGWDDATFGVLERYAHKEFRGDRSAAVRFLVRQGLRAQGYFGPRPSSDSGAAVMAAPEAEPASPFSELARAGLEARLADLERVAETVEYATWLRKRARIELERMTSSLEDDLLRAAAQSAVDRLSPLEPAPEAPEPIEIEAPPPAAPPPPPPSDVRPVLREAFAASAGGDYRQAIALFDQVLASDDAHRTARLGRAVALRRAGKPQEALADLEVVLRAEPRNAAALLARGQILQARGDLDAALSSFDLLVEVAANDWDVWMARGDVLAKMGRNEDALRSYGEALRRNPDDQGLQARIRTLEIAHPSAAPMTLPRPPTPRGIEEGQSYLVREVRRERSLSAFRALAGQKIPSLVLTGRPRDQVRREVGVGSARILGLSYTPGEDLHNPTALASLTRTIERFVEDNQGHGVILLDGLDDLVAGNGFRDTLLFVEHVNEAILQSHAILLVSVAPDALPEREAALLERSLRVLE